MSASAAESQQAAFLSVLARVKQRSRSASDLRKWLGSATARNAGLDDAATADRVVAAAIGAGLVEELIRGGGSADGAAHPRSKSTYRLTHRGVEEAKRLARPAPPEGASTQLIQCQRAYLLFQFLRAAEDRTLARSTLNERFKTQSARDMEMDRNAIDYALTEAVDRGYLLKKERGTSTSYKLTPEGLTALTRAEQYPGLRLSLTSEQWNRLMADLGRPAPPTAAVPRPEPAPPPARPLDERGVLRIAAALKRSDYPHTELIPIPEVRRRVAEEYGPAAAKHDVFDPTLQRLRRDGHAQLIAISDLRQATAEQLADAVPGMNETLYYLVLAREPSDV